MRLALLGLLLIGCTIDVDIDGDPVVDAGLDGSPIDAGSTDAVIDAGLALDAAARPITDRDVDVRPLPDF